MIPASSFNYYQELCREAEEIPQDSLEDLYVHGQPPETYNLLMRYMDIPDGILAVDAD